jgi:hypothetical protein
MSQKGDGDKSPPSRSPRGKGEEMSPRQSFGFFRRSALGVKEPSRQSSDAAASPSRSDDARHSDIVQRSTGSSGIVPSLRKSDGRPRNASGADALPRGGDPSPRKPSPREHQSPRKGKRNVGMSGWLRQKLAVRAFMWYLRVALSLALQKRWFLMVDDWLYWFDKEVAADESTIEWQFLEGAKGSLFLSRCNVAKGEKPKELVIINPSSDNFVVLAASEEERDQWLHAMQKVIDVEVQNFSHLPTTEKRGTLKYRNVPKWFVLKEGVLMWFSGEHEPEVEGSTTLASATVALGETMDGSPALVVATLEGKHVLGAETREEAETWASYVKASINAAKAKSQALQEAEAASVFTNEQVPHFSGTLSMVEGEKVFFFVLEGSVLQWFSEAVDFANVKQVKKNIRGFIALRKDMTVKELPSHGDGPWQSSFALVSKTKAIAYLAPSVEDARAWVKQLAAALAWLEKQDESVMQRVKMTEKEGFLTRGKLKVWAVCKDSAFMIFDSKTSKKAVTTVKLENSGVLETRDRQCFLLFTTVPSLEIFECQGRKADAQRDNFEWFQTLLLNVAKANAAAAAAEKASSSKPAASGGAKESGSRGSVLALAYQQERRSGAAVCASIRKRSEFFFSLRQTTLYWFKSEAELYLKGSQHLCGCRVTAYDRLVSVTASDEKVVVAFETSDASNAQSWGVALQEAIFEADEERGYKKFGYLETKGKRRWVVVSRRHCMWFPSPMKLAGIQNVGAFDSVVLPDCSLTSYGELGFVLSERKTDSKVGEKVTVVSFVAESAEECAEWMRVLEWLVFQHKPANNEGIPFAARRVVLPDRATELLFGVEGNGLTTDSQTLVELMKLPASLALLQEHGQPIVDCVALVSPTAQLKLSLKGLDEGELAGEGLKDEFSFRFACETAVTENVARITLRKQKGARPVMLSPRKALPQPPAGSKPLPSPPAARVPSEVLSCEIVMYQMRKTVNKNGMWSDVVEERTDTPAALLAKSDLREILLSRSRPDLVGTLLAALPATELDQVVQAVINIYAARGRALQLIEEFITTEIANSEQEETLFRTNSIATKLCKFYAVLAGAKYLQKRLTAPVTKMCTSKIDCEIDPSKLADKSKLEQNLANLSSCVLSVLDSVIDAGAEALPPDMAFICSVLWRHVEAKFGNFKFAAVGGFLFLRFICPAVLTPDAHGLLQEEVPKELRRTLTLVAKVLQNISNGVEFGKKEEFMVPLNGLIKAQIPRLSSFFGSLSVANGNFTSKSEQKRDVPGVVVERATDTVYKQMLFQQKKLQANEAVFKSVEPILNVIGVPEKLKRALEKQGQIGKAALGAGSS